MAGRGAARRDRESGMERRNGRRRERERERERAREGKPAVSEPRPCAVSSIF